ncbi:LysM peptidoglycan-binding domain-containing protein [Teredinibacter haidensis]|uniref:LysM peptidoglycan-binding domain-containing protein n=1 Tax=Teredinibacter haidensis TaxID=2731755 RepID=UPI0009FA7E98|nr:LysM peptidoglycan-binding domain-containing protein [Teredinibacter haidensis]
MLHSEVSAVTNPVAFLFEEPSDELSEQDLAQLPEPLPGDIWDRIRAGYQLDRSTNKRVEQQLKWYAKHPQYINRVAKRGERYLYHIVESVEAKGLPMELALLPVVESAFDPFAYSHGRASGIWQFIPGTGKMWGLKQNWWYDGRRDIVASTNAALLYLDKLNTRFDGDWLHALASYNSGSGNVSKSIRKNRKKGKPTDFWNLDLPRETEAYVPKLIALAILIGNPEKYGLSLHSIADEPYFAEVETGSQIDLAQAAELADLSMDTLYHLNPAFNRWATDPKGPHSLLIPVNNATRFKENLSKIPERDRVTWERYTIRNGDTLSTIADQYKISIRSLKAINNINNSFIRAGKTLMVPVAAADVHHYSQSLDQRLHNRRSLSSKTANGTRVDHHVKKGDSVWTIARRYKVSTRQVARWNNMAPTDPIYPGQTLAIWTKTSSVATKQSNNNAVIRKVSYKVRRGDSLHRIADKFQLKVNDILRWNKLSTKKYLQPGQSLTLFVDVTHVN